MTALRARDRSEQQMGFADPAASLRFDPPPSAVEDASSVTAPDTEKINALQSFLTASVEALRQVNALFRSFVGMLAFTRLCLRLVSPYVSCVVAGAVRGKEQAMIRLSRAISNQEAFSEGAVDAELERLEDAQSQDATEAHNLIRELDCWRLYVQCLARYSLMLTYIYWLMDWSIQSSFAVG